jgi:hypothetical protein
MSGFLLSSLSSVRVRKPRLCAVWDIALDPLKSSRRRGARVIVDISPDFFFYPSGECPVVKRLCGR